jgi:hypothetical protein
MKCTLKSQPIDFVFIFLIICFNSYEKNIFCQKLSLIKLLFLSTHVDFKVVVIIYLNTITCAIFIFFLFYIVSNHKKRKRQTKKMWSLYFILTDIQSAQFFFVILLSCDCIHFFALCKKTRMSGTKIVRERVCGSQSVILREKEIFPLPIWVFGGECKTVEEKGKNIITRYFFYIYDLK